MIKVKKNARVEDIKHVKIGETFIINGSLAIRIKNYNITINTDEFDTYFPIFKIVENEVALIKIGTLVEIVNEVNIIY